MILLDTSGLISALFPDQRWHTESAQVLAESTGRLLLSPFVLAEVDYLIGKLAGVALEVRFLQEVERNVYELAVLDGDDIGRAREVIEQYRDLGIGLADASIVVLAQKEGVDQILTLDERHFRSITGPYGKPFRLLPVDEN